MQYGALALYTCWLVRQRCQPHSCLSDCVCLIIYQSLCCEMNAGQTRGGLALQSLCSEWLSWTRKTMCVYNIIYIISMLLLEALFNIYFALIFLYIFSPAYRQQLKQSSNAYAELFHHWQFYTHLLSQPPLVFTMTRRECWIAVWSGHLWCAIMWATRADGSAMLQVILSSGKMLNSSTAVADRGHCFFWGSNFWPSVAH